MCETRGGERRTNFHVFERLARSITSERARERARQRQTPPIQSIIRVVAASASTKNPTAPGSRGQEQPQTTTKRRRTRPNNMRNYNYNKLQGSSCSCTTTINSWRRTLFSLWCLFALVAGQDYYDNNSQQYPDYQDYAGEQGYDDHLYHDYAARQQDKGPAGGYV